MTKLALALQVVLIACSGSMAAACQGTSFILDDDFQKPDLGWDANKTTLSYGPAGATFRLPNASGYWADRIFDRNFTSEGTDLCATASWLTGPAKVGENVSGNGAGVAFWAKDYQNYYNAMIDMSGKVSVFRNIANVWSTIAVKTAAEANIVHVAAGDKNEIEVLVSGNHASVRVNGKPMLEIAGQPPSGSGFVGLFAGGTTADVSVVFQRFQIAAPP